MDELINQVTQRAGISNDQAQTAIQTVVSFLKGRLPGPLGSELDTILGSQNTGGVANQAQQALGNIGGNIGGVLGGGNQPNPSN